MTRYKDQRVERFLTRDEFIRLRRALDDAIQDGVNPCAVTIIKLLILTGARRGEIESLKWREIDFERELLRLEDSKTGQKIIPLNRFAQELLLDLQGHDDASSIFVFAATRGDGHYCGTSKAWRQVRTKAGFTDFRIHDFRHSFASIAASGGASLPVIGRLLGHRDAATTLRYAHLHDDKLKDTTNSVGDQVFGQLQTARVSR